MTEHRNAPDLPLAAADWEALERVERDLGEAAGLPNRCFTSQAFLDRENERLFARTWVLAGFDHELPEPGDVVPCVAAGQPIVLCRARDGSLRAFHNACRHRGARLVAEPCKRPQRIACPYHAWTYDFDGTLIARPYFAGTDPKAQDLPAGPELNLVPVRVETWRDLIFVNLSGDAPPLAAHMAPIDEKLAGYDLKALRYAGKVEFEVAANWKFACENFAENYHVFAAHPKLSKFVPQAERTPGQFEGHCFFNGYRFKAGEEGRGGALPHYPGLSAEQEHEGLWMLLFPTLGIEIWPDQFALFRVIPLAPDRIREEIHVYLIGEAADSPAWAEARAAVFEMWRSLNEEDVKLLEALQAGRRSDSYQGGVFSPYWEAPTLDFARLVARAVR